MQLPEVQDVSLSHAARPPAIEVGTLTLYQCFDLGYAIDLDKAEARLAEPSAQRRTQAPIRQANSIDIAQQPLRVERGLLQVALGDLQIDGALRASIYDLGTVVLALALPLPRGTSWQLIAGALGEWQQPAVALQAQFRTAIDELEATLLPAITKPNRSEIVEDYSIIVVEQLEDGINPVRLGDYAQVHEALLGERRPLAADARSYFTRLSYYTDDLAILSWAGALIVDPEPFAAETAADLIEFANVELLLMRTYDDDIEAELPRVNQRIATTRTRFALPFVRRYSRLLSDVQQLVFEVTEVTERVDNALRVTDDVYWNRLYEATVTVLRVQVWRQGVDHKLALLREAYEMLHSDAEAERSTALEWIVIWLIAFEVVWALIGRH